jgi:rare lipoprotein A
MAVVPLLALRGGGRAGAQATRLVTSDPLAARQVTDRASRSDPVRSVEMASVSAAGAASASAADSSITAPATSPAPTVASHPKASATRVRATIRVTPPTTERPAPRPSETGQASWYDAYPGTCAHPYLPLGTVVTVTDVDNGRSVTCRVEDRGPFLDGRILDMSETTFSKLAPLGAGVIEVRLTW